MKKPESILIYFPTNIGDTLMGLPLLDRLRANYPQSKITAIASFRTKDFLLENNFIDTVVVFNKSWTFRQKASFAFSLRGKYALVVDLKNSFLPVVVGAKQRTPFYRGPLSRCHTKDAYLNIAAAFISQEPRVPRSRFLLNSSAEKKWQELKLEPAVFVACSSLSELKRYPYSYLKKVIQGLREKKYPLVILGEEKEKNFYADILELEGVVDLVGKTSISDAAYLLEKSARVLLCVDSGIMHLGSYLNIPQVVLFGPTDVAGFAPWSDKAVILRNTAVECQVCRGAGCHLDYGCMKIAPERVIGAVEKLW